LEDQELGKTSCGDVQGVCFESACPASAAKRKKLGGLFMRNLVKLAAMGAAAVIATLGAIAPASAQGGRKI